jgi:superfamily II DNA/RNA helicase
MEALKHTMTELHPDQKTILFCNSKSDCDDVADQLRTILSEHRANTDQNTAAAAAPSTPTPGTPSLNRFRGNANTFQRGDRRDNIVVVHGDKSQVLSSCFG